MQAEEGYIYTYVIEAEAWYYQLLPASTRRDGIEIGKDHVDGGGAWGFAIISHDLGGPTLKLEMFHDSWAALREAPELFEALHLRVPRTLDELVEILVEPGFTDATERTQPKR